jgi:hypothetical protein
MFILAPERDRDPKGAFLRYSNYLEREARRFPVGALALATSDWYFDATDHRAPHDAWLLSASFEEVGTGARRENRAVSLRLKLLSAYQDLELEFYYAKVLSYSIEGKPVSSGHGDWRYDEFRLDDGGQLVHEIQWAGGGHRAHWLINADDVCFSSRAVQPPPL